MVQRERPARRAGYTFVELLMVIAIIAVLAALLLSGVNKVLGVAARTEVVTDITQLAQSLEQAKAGYVGHPEFLPSCLVLHNNKRKYREAATHSSLNGGVPGRTNVALRALTVRSAAVLQSMFGRRVLQGRKPVGSPGYNENVDELLNWDGSGNINASVVLSGPECLVFYLGGMPARLPNGSPDPNPRCLGFSTDPLDPTTSPASGTEVRKGPFFPFKTSRLVVRSGRSFYEYLDAYQPRQGLARQPYAYFGAYSANNYAPTDVYRTDFTTSTVASATFVNTDNEHLMGATGNAYYDAPTALTGPGPSTKWFHPNKYQIISAGRDQTFGPGGPIVVSEGSINEFTKDNLVNFSSTELGNAVE